MSTCATITTDPIRQTPEVLLSLEALCADEVMSMTTPDLWIANMRIAVDDARLAGVPWDTLKRFDSAIDDCSREFTLCPECGSEVNRREFDPLFWIDSCTRCGWVSG